MSDDELFMLKGTTEYLNISIQDNQYIINYHIKNRTNVIIKNSQFNTLILENVNNVSILHCYFNHLFIINSQNIETYKTSAVLLIENLSELNDFNENSYEYHIGHHSIFAHGSLNILNCEYISEDLENESYLDSENFENVYYHDIKIKIPPILYQLKNGDVEKYGFEFIENMMGLNQCLLKLIIKNKMINC